MFPEILCAFLLTATFFSAYSSPADTWGNSSLRCVQMVWRHGDRNPRVVWPTDIKNQFYTWPEGLGELTKKGVRQMYDLGLELHNQYGFLLNYTWNSDYVKFFSGEDNRTVTSALALAAGMFPPTERQIWNPDLLWLPIPIHARDFMEWICAPNAVEWACPNLRHIAEEKEMHSLRSDNIELVEYLEEISGINIRNVLFDLGDVVDSLTCELYHNDSHSWPEGVTQSMYNQARKVHGAAADLVYSFPDGKSLTGGWLLSQLVENLGDYVTGDSEKVFVGYSGHDDNLKALAATFGVTGLTPGYASYIAIELHERDDDEIIEVWYKSDSYADRTRLYLADCPDPCSFGDFVKRSQTYFPVTEWDEACGKNTSVYQNQLYAAIGILLVLSVVCLVISIISCFLLFKIRRKHKRSSETKPLITKR